MEIFGLVCMTLLLIAFTCIWVFILVFDGAFSGKRDIPVFMMIIVLALVVWAWLGLVGMSPFTITMNM